MKTLNELFESAIIIADARKKVFFELEKKVQDKVIPNLINILDKYDLSSLTITTEHRVVKSQKQRNGEYHLKIDDDKTIIDAYYNFNSEKFENETIIDEPIFLRSGLIEFTENILREIERLNTKYAAKNEQVKYLLNKKLS